MLNSSWNASYKTLARKATQRECATSDEPLSEVIVDVRSRVFRYMRLVYAKRGLHDRARSVFRAIRDLRLAGEIFAEKVMIFDAAVSVALGEAKRTGVKKCTFVYPSKKSCPLKELAGAARTVKTAERLEEFRKRAAEYGGRPFDVDALDRCAASLEGYLMSDLEGVSTSRTPERSRRARDFEIAVPGDEDFHESDRMCARLARRPGAAVLSEDVDNLLLFGCDMIVREVHAGFFVYVSLKDTMAVFDSVSRRDAVHRCCLLGTDYNLGLKGVGPVKIKKIDAKKARELFETCIGAQHLKSNKLYELFMLP